MVFKPNIVFKVKKGVNYLESDDNYFLLKEALECTSRKMIPTYILCDSDPNSAINPELLSIMGCRTRVVSDIFGSVGSLGRGNICNTSVNLPRLALEAKTEVTEERGAYELFKEKWLNVARQITGQLIHRYRKTLEMEKTDFPTVSKYDLWIEDFSDDNSLENIFRHGTLSLGFIGLSESIEILTGKKYYDDASS